MTEEIVGVLLVGGFSRRFGEPKSFAKKDGKDFYKWSLEALAPVVDSTILITNKDLEARFSGLTDVDLYTDEEKFSGKGPLAGIFTAMKRTKANWYAVIPTDVPFMNQHIFERLLAERQEGDQAIIPVVNGRSQPLIGLYHVSLQSSIEKLLEADQLAMRALLDVAKVKFVYFTDETPFININRLTDYESYIPNGTRD